MLGLAMSTLSVIPLVLRSGEPPSSVAVRHPAKSAEELDNARLRISMSKFVPTVEWSSDCTWRFTCVATLAVVIDDVSKRTYPR
jgi:hypothetical protein